MSQSLSRPQLAALGLVVLLAAGLSAAGLVRVAARQGMWADTAEVVVAFPDAHDLGPGTPVRVRGVPAGQVVAVEYPDTDGPDAAVLLRLRLDRKLADRLYADATAQVHPTGLLGQKVIAVSPGSPGAGPLGNGRLRAVVAPDMLQAAAKVSAVADEAAALLKEARAGNGTVGKLIRDDELYHELKGLAGDTRAMVRKADKAVGTVESEAGNVRALVSDGRDTLRSVRQGTDALQRLPVIRSYVEDPVAVLTRPDCRRESLGYNAGDLFEPNSAILSDGGRGHLAGAVEWVKGRDSRAELVVVAGSDPGPAAAELTRKRAEAVAELLRAQGAHKTGWWARRKVTALGLGAAAPPAAEKEPLPANYVQVLAFTPGS